MALTMSYVRISILGTALGGETWSVNPVFDPTGEFPGWNQAAADAAVSAINALTVPANLLTAMSVALSITGCRLEVRDDGNDSLIGLAEGNRTSALSGSGAARMPAQAAQVISLRTDTPGASGRGRIYWPVLGGTLGTDLKLSSPTPTNLVNDMKTYLTAIRNSLAASFPAIGFDLAVRSKRTLTTPHVVRLQCGNVVDTQRRRRDNLPESYVTVSYP